MDSVKRVHGFKELYWLLSQYAIRWVSEVAEWA